MSETVEPHRTFRCKRGSEMSFGGDNSEYTAPHHDFQYLQARRIASRFIVSHALARTIAELAFAKGGRR